MYVATLYSHPYLFCSILLFFTDPATTQIYTLSLHDALPICADVIHVDPPGGPRWAGVADAFFNRGKRRVILDLKQDRKSTRLNSSHMSISYAVFCLKKKTIMTTSKARSTMTATAMTSWRDRT